MAVGEAQLDGPNSRVVDDHVGLHGFAAVGVHELHAVHSQHHLGELVRRGRQQTAIDVTDGQRRLPARRDRHGRREIGARPAAGPLVRLGGRHCCCSSVFGVDVRHEVRDA